MNVIVVLAHPYEGSFCRALKETVVAHLEERGAQVKVKDLVEMKFNGNMEVEELASIKSGVYTESMLKEQEDAKWADAYVTIAPVWFGMCPGFMKAYFDKLLISGFGYDPKTGAGLMGGKRVFSLFTCGAASPYLDLSKQFDCINTLWDNMFGMCGFSDVSTKFFQGVPYVPAEVRNMYLEAAKQYVDQIFDTKIGSIGQLGYGALLSQSAGDLSRKNRELKSK